MMQGFLGFLLAYCICEVVQWIVLFFYHATAWSWSGGDVYDGFCVLVNAGFQWHSQTYGSDFSVAVS